MAPSILQVKGIGPATAEKLAAVGIATPEDLAVSSPEQLSVVPGFREFRATQVIAHARQIVADAGESEVVSKPVKSKKGKTSKKKAQKKKGKKDKQKKDKQKKDKGKKGKEKKKSSKNKAKKKK